MKFYIAAHDPKLAQDVAKILTDAGHTITARWLTKEFKRTAAHSEVERQQIAREDFEDVTSADMFILCASPVKVSGGKFVEAGIAMAQGKTVYILGHRENMLLWHPSCQQFDNIEDFMEYFNYIENHGGIPKFDISNFI